MDRSKHPITQVSNISKEDFYNKFYKPNGPVLIETH